MDNFSILKKPILTEKTAKLMEVENQYTFVVPATATKGAVKSAIKQVYGVVPVSVNMAKSSPKSKRSWVKRSLKYNKPAYKKAIVKLKDGETIKVYDGGKE